MTIRTTPAPSRHLMECRIWAETTARRHMRVASISAGMQQGQWVADIQMEEM
jgi:hypothetical protein